MKIEEPEKICVSLLYFGARYYNSDISVWLSVDPIAGKYHSMSSYQEELSEIILGKIDNGEMLIINDNGKLINSDGRLIKNPSNDIKRRDISAKIAKEIVNDPDGQKSDDYE